MEENQLQIGITINENLSVGNAFTLYLKDEINANFNIVANFAEARVEPRQVKVGVTLNETIENLYKCLELDYNGYFDLTKIGNTISLGAKKPGWTFLEKISVPFDLPILFEPQIVPISNFKINSVEFLPTDSSPCSKVKVRVTTSQPIAQASVNNGAWFPINGPVYEFEWFRGQTFNLKLTNYIGKQISRNITTPYTIETNSNIILLNVVNSINGGSVAVIAPFSSSFKHYYSLDNLNWQENNSFSGLLEGNYTAYVKDEFGCSKSIPFKIQPYENNIISLNDYHYISKANSIRYAERVDFEQNYKTDENTLSCEMDVIKPYKQIQQFIPADIITTQFKSNYDINNAYVIYENNIVLIPVTKKTNNIGLKDKRTAIKYNIGNGVTGVYFINGNILDFLNNSIIGTYQLNGFLPEWAKKGNVMQMDNVWYKISDIMFDENKNADVIMINSIYTGVDTNTIVASEYNRENYDVFEFPVNMQTYLDKKIRVQIEMSGNSSSVEKVTYLSEEIHILNSIENSIELRYKNTKNTDILYSTGIEHLLRLTYDLNSGKDVNTSENHKTDDRAILLDAKIYESNAFKFEPLTKELWRKLKIALSHDLIFIDGVGYVKDEDFETEGPLGQTNLYVLTATMVKTGQVYSNKKTKDNVIIGEEIIIPEVIGLISIDTSGYIKF